MKNILLFIIISFFSLNLFSQQIFDEMQLQDISDFPEIKSVIIRNPDQALLIVKSQISSLTIQSNNTIIKSNKINTGTWYIYLVTGTHRLTFQASSLISVKKRMYFDAKEVKGINVKIIPSENIIIENNTGIVVINSNPDSAQVYLNDELQGYTPYIGKLYNGRYRLLVRKKSHNDYIRDIVIPAGKTVPVEVNMSQDPEQEIFDQELL